MEISLYNKVPDHTKLKDNFNSFKKASKSFLLKHYFYSVDEFHVLLIFQTCECIIIVMIW
jgi:hypothetical protein